MKHSVIFFTILLFTLNAIGQKIELINDIAYVDGVKYVKVVKISKTKFHVLNIDTKDKILQIKLTPEYSSLDNKNNMSPRVFFCGIREYMGFHADIQSDLELVKFIYDYKLVFIDGTPNNKKVLDYLKRVGN